MFIYYSTAVCSLSFSAQFSGVSGVRGRIKKSASQHLWLSLNFSAKMCIETEATLWLLVAQMISDPPWL